MVVRYEDEDCMCFVMVDKVKPIDGYYTNPKAGDGSLI